MNKIFTTLSFLFLLVNALAQAPETINYQAVVRNADGNLMPSRQIGIQINILQYSANGNSVYQEIRQIETNSNSLIVTEIGSGESSDNFSDINWADGPFFIQTNIDPEGGLNYSITTLSQLLSVPYALHAKTAETLVGEFSENDPLFSLSPAAGISAENISLWNNKSKENDPVFSATAAANITDEQMQKLNNLSGTNTGDQDISGIEENTNALQNIRQQLRSEIPEKNSFAEKNNVLELDNSTAFTPNSDYQPATKKYADNKQESDPVFALSAAREITQADVNTWNARSSSAYSETDPVFSATAAAYIDVEHIRKLNNLSGVNSGNQDISGIDENTNALQDTMQQLRSEFPDPSHLALKSNVLTKNNTLPFEPDSDEEPATKQYVDRIGENTLLSANMEIQDQSNQIREQIDTNNFVNKANVLSLDNTTEYIPLNSFNPATKVYADSLQYWTSLTRLRLSLQDSSYINSLNLERKNNVLELDNSQEFTPSSPYHPATKAYVDSLENWFEILFLAMQRKENFSAEILLETGTLDQLIQAEKLLPNPEWDGLLAIGATVQDFLDRGYSRLLLAQGYITIQELRNAGITTRQLLNGLERYEEGFSNEQILTINRQVLGSEALLQEVLSEGFPIQDLLYYARNLTRFGRITIQELNDVVPFQQLITVGGATVMDFLSKEFTIQELLEVGITIRQMLAENLTFLQLVNYTTLEDFRDEGYTNQELLDEGFTLLQLIDLGATIEELRNEGYTYQELLDGGITLSQLIDSGVTTIEELGNEGYPIQELLDGDIAIQDLLTTYNIQKEYLYGLDYQGGILFYIDEINNLAYVGSEEHSSRRWALQFIYTGVIGTEQGIGYGKSNTEKIVRTLGERDYAAKYCDDLDLNNYTDWFLPSIHELGEFVKYIVGEGEENIYILSSSEANGTSVYAFYFKDLSYILFSSKRSLQKVHPVRSFALTEKGNPETN